MTKIHTTVIKEDINVYGERGTKRDFKRVYVGVLGKALFSPAFPPYIIQEFLIVHISSSSISIAPFVNICIPKMRSWAFGRDISFNRITSITANVFSNLNELQSL